MLKSLILPHHPSVFVAILCDSYHGNGNALDGGGGRKVQASVGERGRGGVSALGSQLTAHGSRHDSLHPWLGFP